MKLKLVILSLLSMLMSLKAETPNIILMITDDQGYGDFGVTGNHIIKTPHIDAMAGRSFEMTRFYVNAVCSPTRASLMTGRSSYRTGITDTFKGRSIMRTEEFTMAEMLKEKGYATGLFGKWHLGDNYPYRPMDQGFDESLYHLGGGLGQPSEPLENGRRYTDPILFKNGVQQSYSGYCCDVYYEEAIKWFSGQKKNDKPFFAYIATNTPHSPFHDVPEKWYEYYKKMDLGKDNFKQDKGHKITGKDDNDRTARIYAMVSNIDENVGKIFTALDKLDITRETIVIYMSDNGPHGDRYVGGFKGRKSQSTEGGLRSPIWFHWPEKFKAGGKSDLIAAHFDLMPTFAELIGAKLSTDRVIDGKSILPSLKGQNQRWNDRKIILQNHRGTKAERLINAAVISQNWKLMTDLKGKTELFNMAKDPYAMNNIINENPEVRKQYEDFYDDWLKSLDNEYPKMWEPLRIKVGTSHETETFLSRQEMRLNEGDKITDGIWYLDVTKTSTYGISFKLQKTTQKVKAELFLNGKLSQTKNFSNLETMAFDKLEIQNGKVELQIVLTVDKKKTTPWHVYIKK
ncbi:MAG: arylsulfatase [Lentisphaeraceae bacterium]|nr:arylsulfatase [Lentisphaeraceae bacterium]